MAERYLKYREELEIYEELINQSILFVLDKEKEATAYSNEAYKLINNIATYLFLENEHSNESFGEEIMQTAIDCVKSFDPSYGTPILHYCRAAWARNKRRAFAKNEQFNNQGNVHYNKKTMQIIQKYVRLAEKNSKDCFCEEYIGFIADCTDRPKDEVLDYLRLIKEGVAYADIVTMDEEEVSLLDFDVANKFSLGKIDNPVEYILQIQDCGDKISLAFSELQDRQKGYISKLITLRIMNEEGISETMLDSMMKYDFFDVDLCRRVLQNERITARIIAEEYNMPEQSISRGYKEFLAKLRKLM